MKQIPLSGKHGLGKHALVDDQDYEALSRRKWYLSRNGYVRSSATYMHRLVMSAQRGKQVDHVNGDRLDNQRLNLRLCTHAENMRNRKLNANNTSGYKGVKWDQKWNKWQASIYFNNRFVYIGGYDSKEVAATAYNETAIRLYGEFARQNKII